MRIFYLSALTFFYFFQTSLISLEYTYECDAAESCDLVHDLLVASYWEKEAATRAPMTYNHLLLGGYFNMPSARMSPEGEIGFGWASVSPYTIWNGRVQLLDRLEISGNYRIFKGIEDPILSKHGFGDLSDKGANVKFAIALPEDSAYMLPGVAIGFEDFLGTRNFKTHYIVATQVFKQYNFEISLGYGHQRYRKWFGGVLWFPFRNSCRFSWLDGLALVAEYDATNYKNPNVELHPRGRKQSSPINFGLKYRLGNLIDLSIAQVRGEKLAASISASYNFGQSEGLLPKIHAPLPYQAPINTEPLGALRTPKWLAIDLAFALQEQGFILLEAELFTDNCLQQALSIRVVNRSYRKEKEVRQRLSAILAALVPTNITYVKAVIDAQGLPVHQYCIAVSFLRRYGDNCLCEQEFKVLAPLKEVSLPCNQNNEMIYQGHLPYATFSMLPKTNTLFGSAKGKFKYALGLNAFLDGFLPREIYYNIALAYTFLEDIHHSNGIDSLNPSQIINVRSDSIRYLSRPGIVVEQAYLQKNWNLGCGWFSRAAIGLFELSYGGIATEFLYYPVNSSWAVGVEAACLRKRTLKGIGFSDKVRKLHGFEVTYRGFLGSQAFLNIYYDLPWANLELRLKAGKFLANDVGIRYEVSRYFNSGLRLSFWYTQTNAHDKLNGQTYYDKGVSLCMPLDFFYTSNSRNKWKYGMSAWLRDIGVIGATGQTLYEMVDDLRQ